MRFYALIKSCYNIPKDSDRYSANNHETKLLLFSRDYAKMVAAYAKEKDAIIEFFKETFGDRYNYSIDTGEINTVGGFKCSVWDRTPSNMHIVIEIVALEIEEIEKKDEIETFNVGDVVRLRDGCLNAFNKAIEIREQRESAIYLGQVTRVDKTANKIQIRGFVSHLGRTENSDYYGSTYWLPSELYKKVQWWK